MTAFAALGNPLHNDTSAASEIPYPPDKLASLHLLRIGHKCPNVKDPAFGLRMKSCLAQFPRARVRNQRNQAALDIGSDTTI